MKRLRLAQWSGHSLRARPGAAVAARQPFFFGAARFQSSEVVPAAADTTIEPTIEPESRRSLPSPPRARRQLRKARRPTRPAVSLQKIPLQSLARSLITPSADPDANFNNSNLAFLGSTIINYHVLEYLVCKWPRLPMAVLYETLRAYAGIESLQQIAQRWGVEAVAAPGDEVDPGLLQWKADGEHNVVSRWGYSRLDQMRPSPHRRGLSSRVVLDDDFGDVLNGSSKGEDKDHQHLKNEAFSSFVRAVVGCIYAHCGREAAKSFVASHILSRQFDPSVLFEFKLPTRELATLCAREGFEPPLARLESETGRASRTPVFVVGIYSGREKLGEGAGASLDIARRKASMVSLKAWYLYSPGNRVRVPSDMMEEGAKPWTPPHIDIGEVI